MGIGKGARVTGLLLQLKDFGADGARRNLVIKRFANICSIKMISVTWDVTGDRFESSMFPPLSTTML